MFETVGQIQRRDLAKRLVSFVTSVLAHVAAFLIFVILPMVFFKVLPEGELLTILMAAPPPPVAPLPPVPPDQIKESLPLFTHTKDFLEPTTIPSSIPPPEDESQTAYLSLGASLTGTVIQGAILGNSGGGSSLEGAFGPQAPPLPVPPPPPPRKPLIHVGGKVQESKLIHRIDPKYPELAIRTRQSGTVVLQVNVDEEGNVYEVRVLSGNPLLNEAAASAVMQWKYSPTLLNGEPMAVTAIVTVIFTLR
jgi:periplasmic protein TonB